MTRNEKLVKERIGKDLAEHVITVRHRDGLYGHWRCQRPKSWNMGFDVVTWPGSLCFTGDMGHYLFKRMDDMISFMAQACRDVSYSAGKCVAHDGRLKEWREETFLEVLADRAKQAEKDGGMVSVIRRGKRVEESVADKVAEIILEYGNYNALHDAEKAMYESGLWDGCDMPSCEEYTVHFLWCLKALEWFCANVGNAKAM